MNILNPTTGSQDIVQTRKRHASVDTDNSNLLLVTTVNWLGLTFNLFWANSAGDDIFFLFLPEIRF